MRSNPGAKRAASTIMALLSLATVAIVSADTAWLDSYRPSIARIIAEATATPAAWDRLAAFTDMFPARLSGSANLERAIDWAADEMKRDGLDNVHKEKVMVPHWVRGTESADIVDPFPGQIAMGKSVV